MSQASTIIPMQIRRDHAIYDTALALEYNRKKLGRPTTNLQVVFTGELGIDQGGLKKEWLSLVTDEVFNPQFGLFRTSNNMMCLYPHSQSFLLVCSLVGFRMAGNMIGLSIKENVTSGISFTRGFIKLILDLEQDMKDLEEVEPELAKSLEFIQNNLINEDLELPFTYELAMLGANKTLDLKENGSNVYLNDSNKEEYIDLLFKAKMFKEIKNQTLAFKAALFEFVPEYLLKIFVPYELELLICGQKEVCIDDFKRSVQYRNCSSSDRLIEWFWEIVEGFTQNQRTSLLMFITGSGSIPYRGIQEFKIVIIKTNLSSQYLPISHTCELELPNYKTKEELEEKLKFVIAEAKEGFHLA